MKQAKTIHHYIWLINKLRHHEHMTLGKINELWVEEKIANGNPIDRTKDTEGLSRCVLDANQFLTKT